MFLLLGPVSHFWGSVRHFFCLNTDFWDIIHQSIVLHWKIDHPGVYTALPNSYTPTLTLSCHKMRDGASKMSDGDEKWYNGLTCWKILLTLNTHPPIIRNWNHHFLFARPRTLAKYVLKFPVQVGLVRIGMVWNVPARNGPGMELDNFTIQMNICRCQK